MTPHKLYLDKKYQRSNNVDIYGSVQLACASRTHRTCLKRIVQRLFYQFLELFTTLLPVSLSLFAFVLNGFTKWRYILIFVISEKESTNLFSTRKIQKTK